MNTNVKQKSPMNQMKGREISLQRAEKIARNINAMDTGYQRLDDMKSWRYWNNLEKVLKRKLSELSTKDIEILKPLLNPEEAKYFNLM
ncbi:MAG: hypothetical protein L0G07_09870 [Chryseobacterium sp.]|nr:hypothetical protein [Chryseobacterium sp.]MDN5423701.1 hypothetical protein [Chryseobacterium sp.]MDN5470360.1 hypothetical protein [Lactococcus lactis]MDN5481321.1 hypothetical protein [Chryseobacterium sp.]